MADNKTDSVLEKMNKRKDLVFEAVARESDRGAILVGTAFLSEGLEALIRAKFRDKARKIRGITKDFFGPAGPLGSFWTKIRLAYALDLIAAYEYRDLELLRQIRNRFAHQIEAVGFDDPEVVKLAKRLESPERFANREFEKEQKATTLSSRIPDTANCGNIEKCARLRIRVSIGYISGRMSVAAQILETWPVPLAQKTLQGVHSEDSTQGSRS